MLYTIYPVQVDIREENNDGSAYLDAAINLVY